MEYTGGIAMTVKTVPRAGRVMNGAAENGRTIAMIDTE
jgi:hypothetical protein